MAKHRTRYSLHMLLIATSKRRTFLCHLLWGMRVSCLSLLVITASVPIVLQAQSTGVVPSLPVAPSSTGLVTGIVTDPTGALLPDALVTLQNDTSTSATTSAADGTFAFGNVPAGMIAITASHQGFASATARITLLVGQSVALPSLVLQPGEVDVSVNALTSKQLAQLQVHAEEQQRVLGVLPNFFVAYDWRAQPLTPKQKFSLVATTFRDPINIIIAAGAAGVQQWQNDLPGYRQGAQGYGKRFGANYGGLVIGTVLGGGVFPVLFHQDPRYFYKGTGSIHSRLIYSLSRSVITRGDNGKDQPAYAAVLGDFSAGAISNAYYPAGSRSGVGVTFANGMISIGSDAISNVFQEFIVRKLTPKNRRGAVNAVTTESLQH